MRKLLTLWLAQWRYSVARELMFRGNFILWILVEVSWFVLQLAFIQVLYLHVGTVAGWSKWEMVLLVALSQLIQQLFQTFFMVNFINFPELVRSGKLDFNLLQPAPALFLISTRLWDVGSVANSALALAMTVYAAAKLHIAFSFPAVASAALLVAVGVAVHYAVLLILVTPSFWMTRAQGFIGAYYQMFQIARQPREAYRGVLRFLFTWIVPLLLVANLPARALFSGFRPVEALAMAALAAGLLAAGIAFFRFGLRRYTSASS